MRTTLRVLLSLSILLLIGLVPPAMADAATLRNCGDDHPVYALKSRGDLGCGTAVVVSSRITNRFSDRSDFNGSNSSVNITVRDGLDRKFKCKWQSGSSRNDVIFWGCNGPGATTILWIWRDQRI